VRGSGNSGLHAAATAAACPSPESQASHGHLQASPSGRGNLHLSMLRSNFSQLWAEFEAWQGTQTPASGGVLSKASSAELPSTTPRPASATSARRRQSCEGSGTPSKHTPRHGARARSATGTPQVRVASGGLARMHASRHARPLACACTR
jgi:hypothetical protein